MTQRNYAIIATVIVVLFFCAVARIEYLSYRLRVSNLYIQELEDLIDPENVFDTIGEGDAYQAYYGNIYLPE